MCKPASFRVLPDRVLFSRVGDSHEQILEEHLIRVTDREDWDRIGVPVELSPPEMNFELPFERWVFALDDTINASHLPGWWKAAAAERQCREALPEWWSYHHVEGGEHTCGAGRTLIVSGTGCTLTVQGGACYAYGYGHTFTLTGGECYANGGGNTITLQGGECRAYGGGNTIIVQGGWCYADRNRNTIIDHTRHYIHTAEKET